MRSKSIAAVTLWAAFSALTVGGISAARADGIVKSASKEAVKGAVKGVQQELDAGNLTRGAKEVTKGMVDGISDAAPQMTSQIVNQANVNRKQLGRVARQVTGDAVDAAVGVGMREMGEALGEKGDGPLADTLVATTERITAAATRGIVSEIQSKVHVSISPWPMVLGFILGGVSSVICGLFFLLMYVLFQRRRVPVLERVPVQMAQAQAQNPAQHQGSDEHHATPPPIPPEAKQHAPYQPPQPVVSLG